jgi:hypothetical protein
MYQWVKDHEHKEGFPNNKMVLGRWLGKAYDIGQALCFWISKPKGQVVVRTTVRPLTDNKWKSDDEKKARNKYETNVKEFIGKFDGKMVYNYPNNVP